MRVLVLAFVTMSLAMTALAQERAEVWRLSPKATREAVRATVEGQLDALRAGEFDAAYEFAASGIRRQFTPAVFAAMIRRGYPALLTHRRFEAGIFRDDRNRRAQVLYTVFDAREDAAHFRYTLVLEDGRWRIEGVVATSPEDPDSI